MTRALLWLLVCVHCAACKGEGGRVGEEAMLLGLNEARAWQRRADLHLQGGDVGAAITDVAQVLSVTFPPGAPEAEDVRLDARARLARLYLKRPPGGLPAEEQALREIEAARKEASRDTFFRAQLESVLAEVYEARAERLQDPAEKDEARRLALSALERAIQIDRRLLKALLGGKEGAR